DLSGNGLADLLRIRNGEICYWPNLGYGRFGAKVTMGNAPLFDDVEHFNPRNVLLVDVDGSGTADIIYLHRYGPRVYFNQAGNRWSSPRVITSFPSTDDQAHVSAV